MEVKATYTFEGTFNSVEDQMSNEDIEEHLEELIREASGFMKSMGTITITKVQRVLDLETIQKLSLVLRLLANNMNVSHDKQILEVAAGILDGIGERKK